MVRWDRLSKSVRVYFDAKGESDLRDPASSEVCISTRGPDGVHLRRSATSVGSQFFVSRAGHIKGWVAYNESDLLADTQNPNRTLMFCFANRTTTGDYPAVQLPTMDPNKWEHDCWDQVRLAPVTPAVSSRTAFRAGEPRFLL